MSENIITVPGPATINLDTLIAGPSTGGRVKSKRVYSFDVPEGSVVRLTVTRDA